MKEEGALSDHEVMMDMAMPVLVEQVRGARRELAETLEELVRLQTGDEAVTRLQQALVVYHGAVDEQSRLMAAGQVIEARAFHAETVEPTFETIHGLVTDARTIYGERAQRAGWIAGWGSSGILVFAALAVGLFFWQFGRARRAVEVIAAERRALGETERHFRSLVQSSTDVICIVDVDRIIRYQSASAERVFGYAPEQFQERRLTDLIHADDRREVVARLSEVAKHEMAETTLECRWRHRDGSWRHCETALTNLLDEPSVQGIVLNTRDVSERKQLEARLLQSQKMEAVGQLAGGIAHDFNNLLMVIGGYAEALQSGHSEDDPRHEDAAEITRAAGQAAALTRQLLAFSRKQVLAPEILDLNGVVAEMQRMRQRLIGEDIEFVTDLDATLGSVIADRAQLEQVIANLAVNARDAMPTGGRLTIETSNVELGGDSESSGLGPAPGPYVVLVVIDTGIGMDEEIRAHIFEPFFTTKEQGQGTGLGLATVHGIVTQSGGDVCVYSEPGQGTTFQVYLPRVEQAVRGPSEASAHTPAAGSETVLLVEDNDSVRGLVRMALAEAEYQVVDFPSPSDALAFSADHDGPIHLVVTDVVMPQMSGRTLAEGLRAERPEMPVLYTSGYPKDELARRGVLDAGIALLQKPFDSEELARAVREILNAPQREALLLAASTSSLAHARAYEISPDPTRRPSREARAGSESHASSPDPPRPAGKPANRSKSSVKLASLDSRHGPAPMPAVSRRRHGSQKHAK